MAHFQTRQQRVIVPRAIHRPQVLNGHLLSRQGNAAQRVLIHLLEVFMTVFVSEHLRGDTLADTVRRRPVQTGAKKITGRRLCSCLERRQSLVRHRVDGGDHLGCLPVLINNRL